MDQFTKTLLALIVAGFLVGIYHNYVALIA